MFFESNQSKFRKSCGPFQIEKNVLEVTDCFLWNGPYYPGVFGLMAEHNRPNASLFTRQEGFIAGGILLFPNTFKLGMRDLSFIDQYQIEYAWNRAFGGQFKYNGNIYNVESLTLDVSNRSIDRMLEIAKDISHNQIKTDVILKVFPVGRIFVVLSTYNKEKI